MTNVILLLVCLVAGMALRMTQRLPENAHAAINALIIHLALPALILGEIHGLYLNANLVWPVAMPWILFALSAAAFGTLGHLAKFSRSTTGALILTAGLANTSFVGLPMIETFYGVKNLSTGIFIDQMGTYLVMSTAGVAVASVYSAGAPSVRAVALRVLRFPPLLALVAALILSPYDYPPWLSGLFHRLGNTVAPLALVSVGFQLRLEHLRGNRMPLGLGLAFKLVLGPLCIALLYVGLLARHGETLRVTLFESAMGPMIGGAIVAMQYGLNPALSTLMVGVGVTLSFITLPLWFFALAAF